MALASGIAVGRSVGVPFVKRDVSWSIGVYSGRSPTDLEPHPLAENPVLTAADVSDVDAGFVADPFCIRQDGSWYMFFEVWNRESDHGDIGMATSRNGYDWTYDSIVIDEERHLAYPQVFSVDDVILLRTGGKFYRATAFPRSWEALDWKFPGKHDATFFEHEGLWYMMGADPDDSTLRIYVADSVQGDWVEHPKSPVVVGNKHIARPGGAVTVDGERLIRFAQDDEPYYGLRIWAFEITELSPTEYTEVPLPTPVVAGTGVGWNADGMHTLDAHRIGEKEWIACVDGWRFTGLRLTILD